MKHLFTETLQNGSSYTESLEGKKRIVTLEFPADGPSIISSILEILISKNMWSEGQLEKALADYRAKNK